MCVGWWMSDDGRHRSASFVTATCTVPSASAITRSVLASNSTPTSRRSVTAASTRTPSTLLRKSASAASMLLRAFAVSGTRSTVAFSASDFSRYGTAARAAAPSSPNAASDSTSSARSSKRSTWRVRSSTGRPQTWIVASAPRPNQLLVSLALTRSEISSRSPDAATFASRTVTAKALPLSSGKVFPVSCAASSAAQLGALIDRLSLQVLYLLPEATAEHAAKRTDEIAGVAGDFPRGLDGSRQRGRHRQPLGTAGNRERTARDRPGDFGIRQHLRQHIVALAGEVARRRRLERIADGGERDARRRHDHGVAGSTSAGRRSFVPGQSHCDAQRTPPKAAIATRPPMAILPQGRCMPTISLPNRGEKA